MKDITFFERQTISLAHIETELHELYTQIAKKTNNIAAKTLLTYIANDSLKHSTIISTIIEEVNGPKTKEQDCDQNITHHKDLIKRLTKDATKTKQITPKELLPLIDTLLNFETLLLDEYKKAFHLTYTPQKQNNNQDNNEDINVFNLIIADEELHQQILMSLTNLCDRKLTFQNNAPVIKYQSPDSWYTPPKTNHP